MADARDAEPGLVRRQRHPAESHPRAGLPQFVDPAAESKVAAFLFLGGVFIFNGTIWCLMLAWGASAMSRPFCENPSVMFLFRRAAGALFLGLGVRLAVSR